MKMHRLLATIGVSALISIVALPAHAERFRVGRLMCTSTPRVGWVIGSAQDLNCAFRASNSRRQYSYEGRIRRVGLDLGMTSGAVLSWNVFARSSRIGPSTLRGSYVGASGNIAFGIGLGANLLIGGSRRTIILQPLSIETSIGLNLAASVTSLTLSSRRVH